MLSVSLGIGPVCRGREESNHIVREKNMQKANYAIVELTDEFVLLRDIGPHDKYMTITNAAEEVVAEIASLLGNRRLEYIDSEGERDQIIVKDGKFAGFRPAGN